MKRTTAIIAVASICLIGAPALAQDGPRQARPRQGEPRQGEPRQGEPRGQMRQLDPEKAKAAWTLQANGVASSLDLDEAQTTKIVEAYLAARTSHGKAVREQREKMRERRSAGRGEGAGSVTGGERAGRGEGGERAGRGEGDRERMRGTREAMRKLADAERAKLKEALAEVLSGKQLIDASRVLGSFNGQWDRMVTAVAGLDAGQETTMAALAPIEKYVATTMKIREDRDRETMRESMREARNELHTSLSHVLTEPQVEKVLASMRGGSRRGGDVGGRRGGPGREDA